MIETDVDSLAVFASDGSIIQRLRLFYLDDAPPTLIDDAGVRIAPWEINLLHWPREAEADLRRGGYLPVCPSDTELWCNCAD
ncbi:MAG: hypothetical protein KDJ31_10855 [Candidatus Competibacteraceae bacterium]|nr:hypothetical protein [Candidatus Competibacteraceae bacterium]MCB1821084.1 hypothetical protein [Candidatus Competibacteraceae bacterium]